MKHRLVILTLAACASLRATINVPLTVEEALYPGDPTGTTTSTRAGIARTNDAITVGIPLPNDTNGVNSISALGLGGSPSVGQFRVLACWGGGTPTGTPATSCSGGTNIKWVLVDTQASLGAGAQNTALSVTNGATGNFGGSNLATDNGTTITVATGAMTVTIQKANTDIFHQVVVGSTTIVAAGASGGLVVMGPASPGTSCGTCTMAYSSINDSSSTAVIEENGPAKTVIKISGQHKDGSGNAYMRFDARLYFYVGKSYVKVTSVLHNADYGASNTFATAFKGLRSYELRIKGNISGTLNWKIAGDPSVCTSGVCSGTMTGPDYAYIYQGQSNWMTAASLAVPVAYTPDTGYTIRNNTTTVASGNANHYPTGWADIADASGNGMLIGTYQIAALGPKSLEFDNGGSDVRIGIWASENGNPTGGPGSGTAAYYQAWPERKIHDFFVEFHTSAPGTPVNEFLKLQQFLVAHAPYIWYNTTCALTTGCSWPLINPSVEDSFFSSATFTNARPSYSGITYTGRDLGTDGNSNFALYAYRYYAWEGGGGGNQVEFHWSRMLNMIRRDWTGGYLDAFHWYRFIAQNGYPYLVNDAWSNHTGDIDQGGTPQQTSANYSNVYSVSCCRHDFVGQEHAHDYGAADYYYVTGDQNVYDAIEGTSGSPGGMVDLYSSSWSGMYGNKGGYINPRSNAIALLHAARLHNFTTSIGDSTHATGIQNQALNVYTKQVHPDLCVSGYPSGCTYLGASANAAGVSRVRGMAQGTYQNVTTAEGAAICSNTSPYRIAGGFQQDILMGGLWEFRNEMGSGWQYYTEAFDLAYGLSQFSLTEGFYDDGTGSWVTSGSRYYLALDAANNVPAGCAAAGNTFDYYNPGLNNGAETSWNRYFIQNQYNGSVGWKHKFLVNLQRNTADGAVDDPDHYQLAQVLNAISTVPLQSLVTATITSVTYSSPNYSITINVPPGATSYRMKAAMDARHLLVDWIGFDPGTNTWIGNPAIQQNWFAGTEITGLPTPSGTTQTFTVSAGLVGGQINLTNIGNWMVKAWASLPTNTWVTQPTHGVPIGLPGWQKLVWNPDLQKACLWGNYHDANSEANNALFCYDYEQNNWMLMVKSEPYHDEHMGESGHQDGIGFIFDPVNHTQTSWCCMSGSSGFEAVYHTWQYDLGANIGLDRQIFSTSGATISPDRPGETSAEYIPSNGAYTLLDGGRGVWTYSIGSPGTHANAWTQLFPTCTKAGGGGCDEDPSSLVAGVSTTFNAADGCAYSFGGSTGAGNFLNHWYRFCSGNWTELQPTGTPPSGRGWAALSADTLNNVILMFGGSCSGQSASCGESSGIGVMNDLWAYNVSGNSLAQLSPSGTAPNMSPHAPFMDMVYDPVHNYHLILDGPCTSCTPWADAPSYTAGPYPSRTYQYRYAGTGPSPGIITGASPGVSISAVNPFVSKVQPGARTRTTNGWAQKPMVAVGAGLVNLARTELGSPFDTGTQSPYPTPYVDSWNGTTWSQWTVSLSGSCGTGGLWYNSTPAYAGGQWWLVTYGSYGQNRLMYVTAASGTTYSVNCAAPFTIQATSTGGAGGGQVFDVGGTPYFVDLETPTASGYPSHNQIYVYSYSGGTWSLVGSSALNSATTEAQTAGFSGANDGSGHPCVTWADFAVQTGSMITTGQSQVHLSCYISGAWTVQGGGVANVNSNNWATDPSLTYLSGAPYVAFTERTAAGYAQLYVRKVSAGSWATVGSGSLNTDPNGNGWAFHPSITNDGTNLYLGWTEYQPPHAYVSGEPIEQRGKAYVSKYNGSAWSPLGGALNADALYGSAQRISLAYSTKPYAAWNEQNFGSSTQQIYVAFWTGSAWNTTPYNITPTSLAGAPFTATETIPTTTFSDSACASPVWSLTNAPAGLSINGGGVVSGTLGSGSAATYSATSVGDNCMTQPLSSIVVNPTPSITTTSLPNGTTGTAYSQSLGTSGGTAPLVCSVSAGILPTGTSLSASCNISGTPTAAGTFSFTAIANDANMVAGSQPLNITINIAPSVPGALVSGGTCAGCRF